MQQGGLSGQNSHNEQRDDSSSEDEEDIQAQAAENRNDSPAAALPIPPSEEEPDLERGPIRLRSRSPRPASWRDWALSALGFGSSTARRREVDRDR